jgi:hypothetical protein
MRVVVSVLTWTRLFASGLGRLMTFLVASGSWFRSVILTVWLVVSRRVLLIRRLLSGGLARGILSRVRGRGLVFSLADRPLQRSLLRKDRGMLSLSQATGMTLLRFEGLVLLAALLLRLLTGRPDARLWLLAMVTRLVGNSLRLS